MRIGDLVEHEHDPAFVLDVREIARGQGARLQHQPLMHGAGAEAAVEIGAFHDLRRKSGERGVGRDALGGGDGGIEREQFAALHAQRFAHGMDAVERDHIGAGFAERGRVALARLAVGMARGAGSAAGVAAFRAVLPASSGPVASHVLFSLVALSSHAMSHGRPASAIASICG